MMASRHLTAARRTLGARAHRLGLTPFHYRLATSVTRPGWLLHPGRLPDGVLRFPELQAPDALDEQLAERLIAAFHRAGDTEPQGMWGWIFEQRQQELAAALRAREVTPLARLLATMFRSDAVVGMATGSLVDARSSRLSRRLFWLRTVDGIVSLAESLGVVAAENPEQSRYGGALRDGLDDLVGRIEDHLGISLAFPEVGSPFGVPLRESSVISTEQPEQVEAAVRLSEVVGTHLGDRVDGLRVAEIGAGYGGMAYWFLQLMPRTAAYTIIDLPIVNVIHGYFLARALGPDRVSLLGEPPAQVRVLPDHALDEVETPFDVLVNKDSFPEMPEEAMLTYLRWGREACNGLVYSFNQESVAEFNGERQNLVPAAIADVGGYRRVERRPSWVRRGYVEETYLVEPAS
jgi:hypothetical protein